MSPGGRKPGANDLFAPGPPARNSGGGRDRDPVQHLLDRDNLGEAERHDRARGPLQLLGAGRARALWISRHTVKDHVKAVYAKLRVASRAELSAKLFHEHIAPGLAGQQVRQFDGAGFAS